MDLIINFCISFAAILTVSLLLRRYDYWVNRRQLISERESAATRVLRDICDNRTRPTPDHDYFYTDFTKLPVPLDIELLRTMHALYKVKPDSGVFDEIRKHNSAVERKFKSGYRIPMDTKLGKESK